jgi:hypothetical protein
MTLFRTSVDADGKTNVEGPRMSGGALRLGETHRARIEIRSNRRTGEFTLFANDEFAAQWNGTDIEDPKSGSGFGFMVQGAESPIRISDIVIAEWNGLPDSARSLHMDDQDVVLMNNGADRFSGKVGSLDEQGGIWFDGRHGRFRFPLDEVSEIRFAKNHLAASSEAHADNAVLRLAPVGAISGQPIPGGDDSLGLISPIMGKLNLSLENAIMIEFNARSQPIDDWNDHF